MLTTLSYLGRPLELLVPSPRLSKATEVTLARYCGSAVDVRGDRRVVRKECRSPEEFCFEAAQVTDMICFTCVHMKTVGLRSFITTGGLFLAKESTVILTYYDVKKKA